MTQKAGVHGEVVVGQTVHPLDYKQGLRFPSEVVRFPATGIECLRQGGAIRSLPPDWRKTPGAISFEEEVCGPTSTHQFDFNPEGVCE